eukprot:1021583-Prymnesium_polylepis.1
MRGVNKGSVGAGALASSRRVAFASWRKHDGCSNERVTPVRRPWESTSSAAAAGSRHGQRGSSGLTAWEWVRVWE